MEQFPLRGRTAIVTGALGLLGREHCSALAEAGARVVAADLDGWACAELAGATAAKHGGDSIGIALDVTREDSLREARDAVLRNFGSIDILVNNAAINDKFEDPASAAEQSR